MIYKFLEKNADDPAFAFRNSRLSIAIKNLSPSDANMIEESYKVCCHCDLPYLDLH